ncbi:predicted protein [Lichtheimia corymbifera JMRC:FSU:9682]|uniref:Peptidase A2 domain-containing protein n=1 Tax=Lichtheimia corymbifera JMRC:FSU:9682 TaxID=1263082 RepID=A0A068SHE4_9FUNG|nr:predicted protein [Lichtheimia corymbifera JMRC:FSU:9682]
MSDNNQSPSNASAPEDVTMHEAPSQTNNTTPAQREGATSQSGDVPAQQENNANQQGPTTQSDEVPDRNPWVPDKQDTEWSPIPVLSPNASPEVVMDTLQRMIGEIDHTLTDLATGENQPRFQAMTRRRDELFERLSTLRRIHGNQTSDNATFSPRHEALVPRHLPAFQFYGGTRHVKNKARFDSAQSFLEEFHTVLEGHSLDVEQHWRRLMPLTVNSTSRAWLREVMAKDTVTNWDTFCQEIIKQYSPPCTVYYRRYHLRTMRQKGGESLRQYSTKFQEYCCYAVKSGIPNNQELVFNYLCSLHRRYRKRSWALVHNRYGEGIPGELEPIVQLVMTLASGERAPEDEKFDTSDYSSDSESDSEDSDSDHSRRKRRRSSSKKKGKAPMKKKGNSPIHRGSNHDETQCNTLHKIVNGALSTQASSQASSSRTPNFVPRSQQARAMQPRANQNLCWHCNKVPYTPGHECYEMKQARARRAQRINNNNIRSRMARLSTDNSMMEVDESQPDKQAQGKHTSSSLSCSSPNSILVPIILQNKRLRALVDTGSDHSIIDIEFAKENKFIITSHAHPGSVITSLKGHVGQRYGEIKDIQIQYAGHQYTHTFEVLPLADNVKVVIGLDLMPTLGISIHGLATKWDIVISLIKMKGTISHETQYKNDLLFSGGCCAYLYLNG